MATITEDEVQFDYTSEEFVDAFQKLIDKAGKLFVIVDDEEAKCKRIFHTQEDADTWFTARSEGTMTEDIAALEFTGNTIPGSEQYQLNANIHNASAFAIYGSTNNVVTFDFSTVDKISQSVVQEACDIYFTISNSAGSRQKSATYKYKTEAQTFLLDEYLVAGVNTVTLMFRGRSTGLQKILTMTYTLVNMELTTSFDISRSIQPNTNFTVTYRSVGDYARTVHFYIDGREVASDSISALENDYTGTHVFNNALGVYESGAHSLQIQATMYLGGEVFRSPLLFREFVIAGAEMTTAMTSADFPYTQEAFSGEVPGFTGTQYVSQKLVWAYYSSDPLLQKASVTWKLFANGIETLIGSRTADVVIGETDTMPEPVKFMPTDSGTYKLLATIDGVTIKEYTIAVAPNTDLYEATSGMTMKLTGLGRSNEEPSATRLDWSSNGYKAEWHNMTFNANSGYNDDAVTFVNGAWAMITGNKPMATEVQSVMRNGMAFGMKFRPYNVDSEDACIARIGNPTDGNAGIFIYPTKAVLRSSAGSTADVTVYYKSEEDVDIYWVIYPNDKSLTDTPRFTFLQVNGVRCYPQIYDTTVNFNVGSTADTDSTYGCIFLGDPNGKAGIKVYNIRTYAMAVSEAGLRNNFIIDSGTNLSAMVEKNDIYQKGSLTDVDVEKMEALVPLIKFTGNLSGLISSEGKPELSTCGFELTHPDYYDQYAICNEAYLKKSGQSTQDRIGPPSLHIKFNKNKTNKLLDRNGKQYPKNRMPILPGYTPENSLRILNNCLESSNAHSGGALSFFNKITQNAQVNGTYVLRTPIQEYILSGQYAKDMVAAHGGSVEDYEFPYKVNFTPTAYSGAAVWRKDENSAYEFLGLYTFIEEKKAFYANGGHSIYPKIMADGTLDPFDVRDGKSGTALYDNKGFLQFEWVTASPYTYLKQAGAATFDTDKKGREAALEKINDPDEDEEPDKYLSEWLEFGNEVIKPLCLTENNVTAWENFVFEKFNMYEVTFFYIAMLTFCGTDSSFRNENWVRYQRDGKWFIKPWDWDMILGLLQETYRLNARPMADLYTKVDGKYIYNGMGNRSQGEDSFWWWDAFTQSERCQALIPVVYQAMYEAGWKKQNIIDAFDEFTDRYSAAMYSLDAKAKYVNAYFSYGKNYLVSDQGDRTSHRHQFLDTNVDYFEQKWGVGDFVNNRTATRCNGATNCVIYLKAAEPAYFGWTISGIMQYKSDRVESGEDFTMTVNRALTGKDILGILSCHKLEKIDMHEFARFFSAELEFGSCYNSTTKTSFLKVLNIGMTKADIKTYGVNALPVTVNGLGANDSGIGGTPRLETLNVQGLEGCTSLDLATSANLAHFYGAGSGLLAFNPADGDVLTTVELPTCIQSITATDVTLPSYGVKFVSVGKDTDATEVSCPTNLVKLVLTGMGNDAGTHALLHSWLTMLKNNPSVLSKAQLVCRGINWTGASKDDIMTLAKLSMIDVTGYIYCNETYTQDEQSTLIAAFGDTVFDYSYTAVGLVCDCQGDGISISASGDGVSSSEGVITIMQGKTAQLIGAGFPISGSSKSNYRWRVKIDEEWHVGTDQMPIISFGYCTLNWKTGVLTTTENSEPNITYTIGCYDYQSFVSGTSDATVQVRVYPNTATTALTSSQMPTSTVDGVIQITSIGSYLFTASNKRMVAGESVEYTGRMTLTNGGVWTLVGENNEYVARNSESENNPFLEYCLNVTALPTEDLELTLKYKSNWRNGLQLTANDLKLAVVAVISQLLINDDIMGNPTLFDAVVAKGVEHSQPASYSSLELKRAIGDMKFAELLGENIANLVSLKSSDYYIPQYMKNVDNFDMTNCTGLNGQTFDATPLPWVKKICLKGTTMDFKSGSATRTLSELKLGSPKNVEIIEPTQLAVTGVTCEYNTFESIKLKNIYGNKTFATLVNLMSKNEWMTEVATTYGIPYYNLVRAYKIDSNIKKSFDGTGRVLVAKTKAQSTQNAYIDTGKVPSGSGNEFYIKCKAYSHTSTANQETAFGTSYIVSGNTNLYVCHTPNDGIAIANGGGTSTTEGSWLEGIEITIKNATMNTKYPVLIGYLNRFATFYGEYSMYYHKQNGVMKEFLIPMVKDGECGMYDLANEKFYGNANTKGQFTIE